MSESLKVTHVPHMFKYIVHKPGEEASKEFHYTDADDRDEAKTKAEEHASMKTESKLLSFSTWLIEAKAAAKAKFPIPNISNDDRGKMHEILVGTALHPKFDLKKPHSTLPADFRDEKSGKTAKQVHDDIKSRMSDDEYSNMVSHAHHAASSIRQYLHQSGDVPHAHTIHRISWTSNGNNDIRKLTGHDDPENQGDIAITHHDKDGNEYHHMVSLKNAESNHPTLKGPGSEAMEKSSGSKNLVSQYKEKMSALSKLKIKGNTLEEKKQEFKRLEASTRKPDQDLAAQAREISHTHRVGMAKELAGVLKPQRGETDADHHTRISGHIQNMSNMNDTVHPVTQAHTTPSTGDCHISQPQKRIKDVLGGYHRFSAEHSGTNVYIYGHTHDGKREQLLMHNVKDQSSPFSGVNFNSKGPITDKVS